MKKFSHLVVMSVLSLLAGCAVFQPLGTDNTPPPTELTAIKSSTFALQSGWQQSVSKSDDSKHLLLPISQFDQIVYSTGAEGSLTATQIKTGQRCWQQRNAAGFTSGVAVTPQLLLAGAADSQIYVYDKQQGQLVWSWLLPNQLLSAPAVQGNIAILKTVQDAVIALDLNKKAPLWQLEHGDPELTLRQASAPVIVGDKVVVGYSDGTVALLALKNGDVIWQQAVTPVNGSFAIQRLVDIAVTPIVSKGVVYAITYQGNLAALSFSTGKILWQQAMPSYTGFCLSGDTLYVTDQESHVTAFDKTSGKQLWQQSALLYRRLNAPAALGNAAIAVGDFEGYIHLLDPRDGHLLARNRFGSSAFNSDFIVTNDQQFLAKSIDGTLRLIQIKKLG